MICVQLAACLPTETDGKVSAVDKPSIPAVGPRKAIMRVPNLDHRQFNLIWKGETLSRSTSSMASP